jgi:hypothetical protein
MYKVFRHVHVLSRDRMSLAAFQCLVSYHQQYKISIRYVLCEVAVLLFAFYKTDITVTRGMYDSEISEHHIVYL